jgi:Uncharacterised nucleotidyltransferase
MDPRFDRQRGRLLGPWPDPRQTLLLHAALDPGPAAVEAWRRFGEDDALHAIDPGTYRLLPLVYRNLVRHGATGMGVQRLRGVYKHAWYRNQLQLRSGARALKALAGAGLETMVLKGAALASCYYHDVGARPMDNFDVLVPSERAGDAMAVLREAGWTSREAQPDAAILRHHAAPFDGPDGAVFDLHWHLQWEAVDDEAMWDAAEPLTIFGVRTRRLCAADQLLHVCVHGSSADVISPIRWIADAMVILRRHGSVFEWDRLVRRSRERRLTLSARAALRYLHRAFDAPVPGGALRALDRAPTSPVEYWAHHARVNPALPGRKFVIVLERYAKLARHDTESPGAIAVARFLQRLWDLERLREVPAEAIRRTLRHGFSDER